MEYFYIATFSQLFIFTFIGSLQDRILIDQSPPKEHFKIQRLLNDNEKAEKAGQELP